MGLSIAERAVLARPDLCWGGRGETVSALERDGELAAIGQAAAVKRESSIFGADWHAGRNGTAPSRIIAIFLAPGQENKYINTSLICKYKMLIKTFKAIAYDFVVINIKNNI